MYFLYHYTGNVRSLKNNYMGFVMLQINKHYRQDTRVGSGYINQFHILSVDGGISQFMQTIDDGTLGHD